VAAAKVPGIDVSTYQGRIDWRAVASTPVRFVIMRATMGNRYRDGRYAQNLKGATAIGLVAGAYHFAKPSPAPWDPRAEADHFLNVARVAPATWCPYWISRRQAGCPRGGSGSGPGHGSIACTGEQASGP
jgi:lysozyme